jgi:hypothetical protein
VFMLMELGTEQPLSFLGSGIERKPALVVIVEDTRRVDAGGCKPSLHSCHSILGRGEHFVDFVCGPVLPVFWRRRIRTEPPLARFFHNIFAFSSSAASITQSHGGIAHSHFSEEVLSSVKIRLGQANAHWQHRIRLDARALDPVEGHGLALLVQDMSSLSWSWSSVGESRNGCQKRNLEGQHGEVR